MDDDRIDAQPTSLKTRLRRLEFRESPFSGRLGGSTHFRANQPHPFRWIHEPRAGVKMSVCLQSGSLSVDTADGRTALRLLSELRDEHFELFRTPGEAPLSIRDVTAFEYGEERDAVLPIKLERDDRTTHTGIHNPNQWEEVADRFFGDRRKADSLRDLAAAESLHAHVFVTDSKELIELRERRRWSVPILTSLEAVPILWSWVRGFGDFWDGHTVTTADYYYWALARALTPNANAGFAALVFGEYVLPSGPDLMNLGQSCLTRLASAIRIVDRMVRVWQLPTDNHTTDALTEDFDFLVLTVAAIHDNLALLGGKYFELQGLRQTEFGLLNRRYRAKLINHPDSRANSLGSYINTVVPDLSIHQELRHQAIHRARLQPTRYRAEGEPEETRVWIYEPMLTEIWNCLTAMGDDPSAWGFSNRTGPHETSVSFIDDPARQETRSSPGEALLDPMIFAVRLLASTSRVIDDFFGSVRFEADAGIPAGRLQALETREVEWPFRQQDRAVLLLTSPISGLA